MATVVYQQKKSVFSKINEVTDKIIQLFQICSMGVLTFITLALILINL